MSQTNILWIDSDVNDYQIFVDSVNTNTQSVVYSSSNTQVDLWNTLSTSVDRIGIAFSHTDHFLGEPFYSESNATFFVDTIQRYQIKNIDFLACDTLRSPLFRDFYKKLHTDTGVIVGASDNQTGNLKYGGDWILESTSEDIESIYFTKNIEYYTYLLGVLTATHMIILKSDGLWGVGQNQFGQLGSGITNLQTTWQNLTILQSAEFKQKNVKSFALGGNATLVLMDDNTLWISGYQPGYTVVDNKFTKITTVSGTITKIKGGVKNFLVLTSNNILYGIGEFYGGQLGIADTYKTVQLTPLSLPGMTGTIIDFALSNSIVVLTSDKELYVSGNNADGQLGDSSTTTRTSFFKIDLNTTEIGSKTPEVVECGSYATYLSMSDGSIYGAGARNTIGVDATNGAAQMTFTLALNTKNYKNGVRKVKKITATDSTIVVMTDKTVWGIGNGGSGSFGGVLSNTTRYGMLNNYLETDIITTPTLISDAYMTRAGSSYYLDINNRLYVTGSNIDYQLSLPKPPNNYSSFNNYIENVLALPESVIISSVPNPSITNITPTAGTKNTSVTITGTLLDTTTSVLFGGVNASINLITATKINVSVPVNSGNVSIVLTNGSVNTSFSGNFTYQNPSITTISPLTGTTNTLLSISGANLSNTSFVKLQGYNTSFTINSSVSLTASVNASSGNASVTVVDNLGNNSPYSGNFTYQNPTVTSINSSGAPNTTVVITGTNLINTSYINFSNLSTKKFTAFSDSINVSVPFAYGNVSVTVIDTVGNNYVVPGSFLYKTPALLTMSPETGPSNSTVTLGGFNLANTSYILFGNVSTRQFTATANTINVSTPLQNGNVSVVVVDTYGTNISFSRNFLLINTVISDINPTAAFPKTNVTLTGSYFTNTSFVYFGNTSTNFSVQSDNIINASVPNSSGNASISIKDKYDYTTYYPGNFTYKNMTIDTITPLVNVKNSTITVNGEDLANVISATVGSSVANVRIISNYQLQLTVPTPSGNGKITLTDSYGNTVISSQTFTTKVPTVTSIDKSTAKIGETLTIYGTDLTYMNYVVFGSERATQNVVITNNQITCTIPFGINTVSLQILDNFTNSITLSSAFTYIQDTPIPKLVLANRPYFTVRDASNNLYSSSGSSVTKNNNPFYTNTVPISGIALDGNLLYMCEYENYRIAKYNLDTQTKTYLTILSSDNVQPNIIKVYDQFVYVICNANPATANPDYLYIFNLSANTYQRKALSPTYTFQGFTKGQIKISGVYTDCLYFSAITKNNSSNGRVCVADVTGTITDENYITNYNNPIDLVYINQKLYIDGSTVNLVNVNSPSTALATYQSSPSSQYNSVFYGTDASGNNVIYMINTTTNAVETVPAPSVLSSAILANTMSPSSGTQNTRVVFTGQNFLASDYTHQVKGVLFQSVPATNFTIVSSTLLYCDAPAGGGNATIQLVDMSDNPIQTSLVFIYQTPAIIDNYPKRSIANDYMYIYGNNMNLVTSVLIGSLETEILLIRLDYLRVLIPNGSGTNQSITLVDNLGNTITNPAYTFSYYVYNSTICFPKETLVKSDQGYIPIQKLVPGKHTVNGKDIVAITETYSMDPDLVCIEKDALRKNCPRMKTFISPRHKIYDKGKMKAAFRFVGCRKGFSFVPYQKELLYNVLLKEYGSMNVQGLICETLDPVNPVAKHYLQKLTQLQ